MRKLQLKKETLAELSAAELTGVVGAGVSHLTLCLDCINDISFEVCPTVPVEKCLATVTG